MSKKACVHLEAHLPQVFDGDFPQIVSNETAAAFTQDVFSVYRPSFSLHEFRDMLESYGMTDRWDVELLEAKYFYGLSQEAIAKELNYVDRSTVSRRLKELRAELERRGFKPKGRK